MQERERVRALEQKKGATMILDQLADRERERAAAEEQRRREGEEMKRRIEDLKAEEQRVRCQGRVVSVWWWVMLGAAVACGSGATEQVFECARGCGNIVCGQSDCQCGGHDLQRGWAQPAPSWHSNPDDQRA